MFKIIKKGANNFWHYYNNDAKKLYVSKITFNLEEVANTFVLVQANGSNVPANKVLVTDIIVIDETDASVEETFATAEELRVRLNELGYGVVSSGGGGIPDAPNNSNAYVRSALSWVIGYTKTAIDNLLALKQNILVAGDNITIDNTDPLNPIISSSGGGGSQDLQDVTELGAQTNISMIIRNDALDRFLAVAKGSKDLAMFADRLSHTSNGESSTQMVFAPTLTGAEIQVRNLSGTMALLSDIPIPDDFVQKSDYTPAHSVLVQQSGTGSPSSVSIGNNQILGRLSGGGSNIKGLSTSEVKTLLDLSGTNSGDNATNTTSNAYADAKVENTIVDGVTDKAPSQNAVFDALALKIDKPQLLRSPANFNLINTTAFQKITANVGINGDGSFNVQAGKIYNIRGAYRMVGIGGGSYSFGAVTDGIATFSDIQLESLAVKSTNIGIPIAMNGFTITSFSSTTPNHNTSAGASGYQRIDGDFLCLTSGKMWPSVSISVSHNGIVSLCNFVLTPLN